MDAPAPYQSRTQTRNNELTIRAALPADADALWSVIEPIVRAGETYPLPREMSKAAALAYWCAPAHEVLVAEANGAIVGTYYLRANQDGGGKHVANCGYMVAANAVGRGVGRAMCAHSVERARARGFRAMQFNFVIASNARCGYGRIAGLPYSAGCPPPSSTRGSVLSMRW
jgi:GNAT superfamily N-acetyltransferase